MSVFIILFVVFVLTLLSVSHILYLYKKHIAINRINKISENIYKKFNEYIGPRNSEELMDKIIKDAINKVDKGSTRIVKT